jgi:nucleoside-diphosphate-sugar epimerase
MKVLITGNMGYIGPVVARHFKSRYPEISLVGYDMGFFASCLTGTTNIPERFLSVQHFGDVRELGPEVFDGVDSVVHLAAISNDPMGNAFEELTFEINHRASVDLARAAKKAGIGSYVFASSCSMYGFADEGAKTEESALNPLTAYAKSKVRTETDLKEIADDSFTVTCLRFSTACGMSDRLRLDLVLNDFVAGAVASRQIAILSDGTPWRPLIDVKDMARAIEWAVFREQAKGGRYLAVNVGSNEWNYQVRDLAAAVSDLIPGVTVSINKQAAPDKRSYRVNFDLYRRLAPQHQPQVDLKQSILELRAGLEGMSFADTEFRSSRLMRLKVLNGLRSSGAVDEKLRWAMPKFR